MLEKLAKKNADKLRILKVDVRENQEWAVAQKVRGIPTFQIYRNGHKLEQFAGGYPEEYLQKKIDDHAVADAQSASTSNDAADSSSVEDHPAEQVIKPMPKDWLPPGVTRK